MNFRTILILGLVAATKTYAASVGQVGMIEGEVLIDGKAIQKTTRVSEGAVIEVKKGKATLFLGKGSVFNLGSNSKMVVNQYAEKSKDESAELDLNFGRTRALIFNNGSDKKDIKIKTRAATMGVRGTEVYIDAPKDNSKPVQFFTFEGKAEVKLSANSPAIEVPANKGLAIKAVEPQNNQKGESSSKKENSGNKDGQNAAPDRIESGKTLSEVKQDIQQSKLGQPDKGNNIFRDMTPPPPIQISNQNTLSPLPPVKNDPIADTIRKLTIKPKFCDAVTAAPCL